MSATQLIPYSRREGSRLRTEYNWVCRVTDAVKRPPNLSVSHFFIGHCVPVIKPIHHHHNGRHKLLLVSLGRIGPKRPGNKLIRSERTRRHWEPAVKLKLGVLPRHSLRPFEFLQNRMIAAGLVSISDHGTIQSRTAMKCCLLNDAD